MRFSAHCLLWTDRWSNDTLALIDRVAGLGLDAIEIPMRDHAAIDPPAIKERLAGAGIDVVCCVALPQEADITSSDATLRAAGIHFLKVTVAKAAELGSKIVTGVIYAPWNKMAGRGPTQDELNHSADSLREVARYAQERGVRLGVEAVNRYETYLVNTAEQARSFVNLIGEPNVGIHLDTFHMNIEEKNIADAVRTVGSQLFHLHVIENDRGTPGTGHVAWDPLFATLAEIKYTGFGGIETFLVLQPQLANLIRIWRKLAPDGDTLVREGLAFLRGKAREYGLAEVS